ncbi:hypothetical protein L210DRAFT_2263085 [Boletus edulis BED1]|uniref:Uncharacterized protein n=1 Tax=Boletus edulis BED1 TaxID=1328754 RepID=A0AAD4GDF7_BOLED|nr:hypothetical protein L210DRAFT_2263085 [Boletus edulis BED1]
MIVWHDRDQLPKASIATTANFPAIKAQKSTLFSYQTENASVDEDTQCLQSCSHWLLGSMLMLPTFSLRQELAGGHPLDLDDDGSTSTPYTPSQGSQVSQASSSFHLQCLEARAALGKSFGTKQVKQAARAQTKRGGHISDGASCGSPAGEYPTEYTSSAFETGSASNG